MNRLQMLMVRAQSISEETVTPDLYKCADAAYAYYTSLFGLPKDNSWSYEIVAAPTAVMARDPFRRMYILTFRCNDLSREAQLASVAHEMYHRVTSRGRTGLHRYVWVDEMLASLVTHKFLCLYGLEEYAEAKSKLCYAYPTRLDMKTLKRVRRKFTMLGLVSAYPPGFGPTMAVLGTTLEGLVGWKEICSLIHFRTWPEWLATLPPSVQIRVRDLIEE